MLYVYKNTANQFENLSVSATCIKIYESASKGQIINAHADYIVTNLIKDTLSFGLITSVRISDVYSFTSINELISHYKCTDEFTKNYNSSQIMSCINVKYNLLKLTKEGKLSEKDGDYFTSQIMHYQDMLNLKDNFNFYDLCKNINEMAITSLVKNTGDLYELSDVKAYLDFYFSDESFLGSKIVTTNTNTEQNLNLIGSYLRNDYKSPKFKLHNSLFYNQICNKYNSSVRIFKNAKNNKEIKQPLIAVKNTQNTSSQWW